MIGEARVVGTIREEEWLTVRQAAELKGVSERIIYRHLKDGKLAGRLFLGIQLVRREHVEAWQVNEKYKRFGDMGGRPKSGS